MSTLNKRYRFHIDPWLLTLLFTLTAVGLLILYSASNENRMMIEKQALRFLLSYVLLLVFAFIPPRRYQQWAPWLYGVGLILLFLVLFIGRVEFGARRWIHLSFINFQPSEIMLLAMPMMLAWYFADKKLPPTLPHLLIGSLILVVPVILIAKQPDLGTAIIIAISGCAVLLFAGISWRLILVLLVLIAASTPVVWHFMHPYQKARVMVFLNPESAPLGAGYHIIQSKIAIGSGGIFGKGWLKGTQSHLAFLPAHATDFIFAVSGEELGLIGSFAILAIYFMIFLRCIYISSQAQSSFTRLLSASLSLVFMISALINIGMVIGILPVVGVPLPLISYGGSSLVISMISFGIIMSIHTHRKLWSK